MTATQRIAEQHNMSEKDAAQTLIRVLSVRGMANDEYIAIANAVSETERTPEIIAAAAHEITGRKVFTTGIEYRGKIMNLIVMVQREGSAREPKNILSVIE